MLDSKSGLGLDLKHYWIRATSIVNIGEIDRQIFVSIALEFVALPKLLKPKKALI